MAGVDKNRRVMVPGTSLEVSYVVGGKNVKNAVIAIRLADRIVMVFYDDKEGLPSACSMTVEQAKRFTRDVRATYQAIADDAQIAQLEREFGSDDA